MTLLDEYLMLQRHDLIDPLTPFLNANHNGEEHIASNGDMRPDSHGFRSESTLDKATTRRLI